MSFAVAGVYHLYFGDASKHPIIGNYRRSVPELPQKIVLTSVSGSRPARLWQLCRDLLKIRSDADWALQCHDFLAAVIGVLVWKGRVIYDSHEIYQSFARRPIVARLIAFLERFAIRHADITIFPSNYRSDFYDLEGRDVRIIENLYYPYGDEAPRRASIGENTAPLFVYTGAFTPRRANDVIVNAFRDPRLAHARLLLAGQHTAYLDELLPDLPANAEYAGELSHEQVSELLARADAGFALYRPINENNRRCAPTKIFELLYFGLKVIANESPYVEEIKARPGGHRIETIDEISVEAIVHACERIGKATAPPDDHEREAVCWESQMAAVRALYA